MMVGVLFGKATTTKATTWAEIDAVPGWREVDSEVV
jgi:hypothetical protein